MKIIFVAALLLAFTSSAYAAQDPELLKRTAVCVKALLQKGHNLDQIVEVFPTELMTTPRKQCIMVVTDRKPNTECADDPMVGPNIDQGSAACINSTTNEVDYVGYFQSLCPPPIPGQSVLKDKAGRVFVSF